MLKIKVKASLITNLTDARYFAAWEVEWLGFNFDEGSAHYIPPVEMKAIKEWVEGVKTVGEFSFASAEHINSAIEVLELDMVQVGMFTDFSVVEKITNVPVIKEVVITSESSDKELEFHLNEFNSKVECFLLSFEKDEMTWEMLKNGEASISFSFFKEICELHNIILNINLSEKSLDEILTVSNLHGLNVKGGEEEKVGVKSFDELDEIFEALEILI